MNIERKTIGAQEIPGVERWKLGLQEILGAERGKLGAQEKPGVERGKLGLQEKPGAERGKLEAQEKPREKGKLERYLKYCVCIFGILYNVQWKKTKTIQAERKRIERMDWEDKDILDILCNLNVNEPANKKFWHGPYILSKGICTSKLSVEYFYQLSINLTIILLLLLNFIITYIYL